MRNKIFQQKNRHGTAFVFPTEFINFVLWKMVKDCLQCFSDLQSRQNGHHAVNNAVRANIVWLVSYLRIITDKPRLSLPFPSFASISCFKSPLHFLSIWSASSTLWAFLYAVASSSSCACNSREKQSADHQLIFKLKFTRFFYIHLILAKNNSCYSFRVTFLQCFMQLVGVETSWITDTFHCWEKSNNNYISITCRMFSDCLFSVFISRTGNKQSETLTISLELRHHCGIFPCESDGLTSLSVRKNWVRDWVLFQITLWHLSSIYTYLALRTLSVDLRPSRCRLSLRYLYYSTAKLWGKMYGLAY